MHRLLFRLLSLMTVLAVVFTLASCSSDEQPTEATRAAETAPASTETAPTESKETAAPTEAPTVESTQPASETAATEQDDSDTGELVRTARDEKYSFTDGVGHHYDIEVKYPEIHGSSSAVKAANKEIAEQYDRVCDSLD